MAKKGKGSKKKQNKEDKKDTLTEVDKEQYEIQIADLNKKLTRIKQRCSDLEKENVEVKKQYKTLEDETSDIIAHLKKSLTQKHEEIRIVTDKLQALQSTKATEKDKYQEQIAVLEKDYKTMHDTFTAEIKLLAGQLSSLESFKNNREAMVRKLTSLEEELKKKDEHHELALRDNENKYILMKEKLSGYVEERLLKLSLDLQKQTQYTITETTHNIVKENIAINNELNLIIGSWQKIFDENEKIKDRNTSLKREIEITKELKDKTMEKNHALNQVIECLYDEQEKLRVKLSLYQEKKADTRTQLHDCLEQLRDVENKIEDYERQNGELSDLYETLKATHKNIKIRYYQLQKLVKKAVIKIQEVIGLQEGKTAKNISNEDEFTLRRQLLNSLLDLFDSFHFFQEDLTEDEDLKEYIECEEDSLLTCLDASPVFKDCGYIKKINKIDKLFFFNYAWEKMSPLGKICVKLSPSSWSSVSESARAVKIKDVVKAKIFNPLY